MSWLQAVSNSGDDVFDENADEMLLQNKEWVTSMKRRVRDGFVDGAVAGEDESLPVGFKQGYQEGAAQTLASGRLKGILCAIWCWCEIQHPEKTLPASVTDLLQRVSKHEDAIQDRIRIAMENPPPSVNDVSESLEDLVMNQADPGGCGQGCTKTDCCKKEEQMDMDPPKQAQTLCSGSSDSSSSHGESFSNLLQDCLALVSELGLPQEMKDHIQELRNI